MSEAVSLFRRTLAIREKKLPAGQDIIVESISKDGRRQGQSLGGVQALGIRLLEDRKHLGDLAVRLLQPMQVVELGRDADPDRGDRRGLRSIGFLGEGQSAPLQRQASSVRSRWASSTAALFIGTHRRGISAP